MYEGNRSKLQLLEPFGEVGGDVPEYFSSRTHFAKIEDKKLLRKIKPQNLTDGINLCRLATYRIIFHIRLGFVARKPVFGGL